MAKKKTRARVPKRLLGVKIPRHLRKAGRPIAEFLDSSLGQEIVAEATIAMAIGLARSERMRAAFQRAGENAKRSGSGIRDVATHLGRAAVLPLLLGLRARLPGEAGGDQEDASPAAAGRRDRSREERLH